MIKPNILNRVLFIIGRFSLTVLGVIVGNTIISRILLIKLSLLITNSAVYFVVSLIPFLLLIASIVVLLRFFPGYGKNPAIEGGKFFSWVGIKFIGEAFLVGIFLIIAIRSSTLVMARLFILRGG
jgi:hypothetical protein